MAVAGVLPVLLGGDANVYGMARSFYEAYGVHSVAVCKRALPALAHSRLVKAAVENGRLEEDGVFTAVLTALAKAHPDKTCLLVSCADGYTMQLARCREALAPYYRFACPDPATVRSLGTKEGFARVCAEQGLRTPRSVTLAAGAPLPDLPFAGPVIVKPADSPAYWNCHFPGKRKVYLTHSETELERVVQTVRQGGYTADLLLQEYIPGPDTALGVVNAYCARDGSVPWIVQGQVLLQERTPEGIGNYGAILTEPARQDTALLESLANLLRRSGWRGYANFDLKYDRCGEPVLFEMNPRQGRASYFCTAAGANLARPLVEDLVLQDSVTLPVLRPSVWYTAPWGVVRRYCPDRHLLRRAASLRYRGRGRCHLLAPGEGPARRFWFLLRQGAYGRKMRNHS
ncbi:hypothetical protein SUBVAR_04283 [Subdoligranulum variabile DSM 15176]|uniref:ATP-grasp domain-containing protein n=1 Tax=Subdoligranulum variabile DSM 15176 TaxID=411471 RepID=D1PIW8_9FIRM|nr:hypothetical protein SUBVAR_04283 [Subdoligranulum variabile DSM 15176]